MRQIAAIASGIAMIWSASACAGEKPVYQGPPDWVQSAELPAEFSGPPELLADFQHRLEDGVVYSYHDTAVRIDNSQSLMAQNTVSIDWLPDKGDLILHRLEIHREGQVIDLLADGAEFDVIRREQNLEARLLDGELTATLSIPGLRVGDVLRTSYTVSTDDQALGDEAQVLQFLGSEPWRVGMGRAIVSWSADEEVYWKAEENATLGEPQLRDGYRYLAVELPLAEPKEMPHDAPSRYHRPAVLRVGSFADWSEISRVMAPHFLAAAEIAVDGPVAEQAAIITRETSDPLERAALATRLVQDKVSYLLNGLDGGNYLPQQAEFTWEKRYGDCKAKSVLLLALLMQMGIEAEAVVVTTGGGDALPYLLPVPGNFDHVIVRARIGNEDYWLDGTSAGTRLANIGDVPPFHYALPLRAGGADLMPMRQREKALPDMVMTVSLDHSAGIDFPQLFSMTMEASGPAGAALEAIVDANDPEWRRRMASGFAQRSGLENSVVTAIDMSYDKQNALGRVVVEGLAPPSFDWLDGKLVAETDTATPDFGFNPNRARAEWRDIPVATPGPSYVKMDLAMILPQEGRGFSLTAAGRQEASFANTRLTATSSLDRDTLRARTEVRTALGEIAPADIANARRQALRIQADTPQLVTPTQVTWRWDLSDAERRAKAAPILAAYDAAIELAEADDYGPLTGKALFLQNIYEHAAALAAYDELIEKSPSAWAYLQRSSVQFALGRPEEAIADMQASYDLEPYNSTAFSLAMEMAYAGQAEQAIELLDTLPVTKDDQVGYAHARATVTGLMGDTGEALSLLEHEVAVRPEDSVILNADCWFRGLFNVALETAVGSCTRAVERADQPMAALDSRAMVQFRLGNYDAAIEDLDAVLRLAPAIADSRYLRGVIRLRRGDPAGQKDIETALRMAPRLAEFYARHGVGPGS